MDARDIIKLAAAKTDRKARGARNLGIAGGVVGSGIGATLGSNFTNVPAHLAEYFPAGKSSGAKAIRDKIARGISHAGYAGIPIGALIGAGLGVTGGKAAYKELFGSKKK